MSGLAGKRILVARTVEQSSETADLLTARGAKPLVFPLLRIVPPADPGPMQRAIAALPGDARAVAFTSVNGVARTFGELARQGRDVSAFAGLVIGAIGSSTAAALAEHGVHASVVAAEFRGESLADELQAVVPRGARVVVFRAKVAREDLPNALRAAGRAVDVVPVYETHPPPADELEALRARFVAREIDGVLLTSASTAKHLASALGERAPDLLAGVTVAAIGPVTAEAATALGVRVDCTADPHTLERLLEVLAEHLGA